MNAENKQFEQVNSTEQVQPEQTPKVQEPTPEKRGLIKKAAIWLISPGNPFPSGTGRMLKNMRTARRNLAALNEVRAERLKLEKNKEFDDYVQEYGLNDADLAKRERHQRKVSIVYGSVALLFLIVTLSLSYEGHYLYSIVTLVITYMITLLFAIANLRAFQIRHRQLLGFSHWLSNPKEWF